MTATRHQKARRANTKLNAKKRKTGKRSTRPRRPVSTKARKPANTTPETNAGFPLGRRSVGAALLLLVATILGHHLVQTHQRLETVQTRLNTIREDSIHANRRAVELEETAAHLEEELRQANAERNQLQSSLKQAASQIQRLSNGADAARFLLESRRAQFEAIQSQLDDAKRTAEQAEAQAANFGSRIDEMRYRLQATQAELEGYRQAALQARSEAEEFKAHTVNLQLELGRGQQTRESLETELDQAKSHIKQLKEASLRAKRSVPKLAHATVAYPPHGPKTRDYLIRTIAFEAAGETELGQAAVAHVVLNRMSSGKWGRSIEDVVTSPWQFEPWMTRRKEMEKLDPFDRRFQKAAKIADAVLAGEMPDPTAGATHFLNPVIVRQRRGGSLPSWAHNEGQPIGRHVFYAPKTERDDARRVSTARPARVSGRQGPG